MQTPPTTQEIKKAPSRKRLAPRAIARAAGFDGPPSPAHLPAQPPAVDTAPPVIRLIPLAKVCDILGLKDSTVLEMTAKGELPGRIKFGTSRRAAARWLEHEIIAFVLAKAAERTAPNPNGTTSEQ